MSVRIVVVDDQEVVRAGFGALLDTQPDFTVVGSAADGARAVQLCQEQFSQLHVHLRARSSVVPRRAFWDNGRRMRPAARLACEDQPCPPCHSF